MRQSNRLSGATLEGMIEKNLKEVQRELEALWQQLN
ncbi:plasmid mobilization relaxosome protein MobC, partial [Bacillus dicomae]